MSILNKLNESLLSLDLEPISYNQTMIELEETKETIGLDRSIELEEAIDTNKEDLNQNQTIFLQNLSVKEKLDYDFLITKEVNRRLNNYQKVYNKRNIDFQEKQSDNIKKIKKNINIYNEKIKELNELITEIEIQNINLESKKKILDKKEKTIKGKEREINNSMKKERKKLDKEYESLTKLKQLFESTSDNRYIKLNVGGKIFETTYNTLTSYSGYFKGLLSGNFSVLKDNNENIFIDRCPNLFTKILELIRNIDRHDPIDIPPYLINELDFYLIEVED